MTLYSRVLTYASITIVLIAISYVLYNRFLAPLPGDTTSLPSLTLLKEKPTRTDIKKKIGKNVKMTKTGAFSFMYVTDEIKTYQDTDPIMYPVLTFHKSTNDETQDGPIAIRVLYNRLTSEIVLGFYNIHNDVFTVPISTSMYKEKVSVVVRLMNMFSDDTFLANVYLNGEYILSRGIPISFGSLGNLDNTIVVGENDGVHGRIQNIRVWDNAETLTERDFVKVSQDPFLIDS